MLPKVITGRQLFFFCLLCVAEYKAEVAMATISNPVAFTQHA